MHAVSLCLTALNSAKQNFATASATGHFSGKLFRSIHQRGYTTYVNVTFTTLMLVPTSNTAKNSLELHFLNLCW